LLDLHVARDFQTMPIASLADFNRDDAGGGDGASGKDLPPFGPGGIYHEKQVASMCAVHAVNNMLQGPLFQYSDFGRVAQELDRAEAQLTGGAGLDGSNARHDGFFNVQVMQAVLGKAGYQMTPAQGEGGLDPKADTAKEIAFILNKREHWFSLRRIGREWFDLNSCIKTPQHYTDGDVRFHVSDAVKQGYSVFVVRGSFPKCSLEEDAKKLVEAVQGCGRPGQGYSLFAGGGQSLGGGAAAKAVPANDAAAMRAARLARLGGGGAPAPPPPEAASTGAYAPAEALPTPTPAPAPAPAPAAAGPSEAVQTLMAMGFEQAKCEAALTKANGNLETAVNNLLSG
jgi:hypothetical protein